MFEILSKWYEPTQMASRLHLEMPKTTWRGVNRSLCGPLRILTIFFKKTGSYKNYGYIEHSLNVTNLETS